MKFGCYIRERRLILAEQSKDYSVRKVAAVIGVQPSYLSKVERDEVGPPGEGTILRLAEVLGEDPDVLLAAAGKVSSELRAILLKRPKLLSEWLRQIKELPDHAVLRVVREVRDGTW